jgi:hypothetical protein
MSFTHEMLRLQIHQRRQGGSSVLHGSSRLLLQAIDVITCSIAKLYQRAGRDWKQRNFNHDIF